MEPVDCMAIGLVVLGSNHRCQLLKTCRFRMPRAPLLSDSALIIIIYGKLLNAYSGYLAVSDSKITQDFVQSIDRCECGKIAMSSVL